MKCFKCKKERSYFDMQPMRHEDVGLSEPKPWQVPTPPKPLVCHVCLDWKKEEEMK